MYPKQSTQITKFLLLFLLLKPTLEGLNAQTNKLTDPFLENLLTLIDDRLEQPGGDTAHHFIFEKVRLHCGDDSDCLYGLYDKVLQKLELGNEFWAGIPVAKELVRLAQQKGKIEMEAPALRRLIVLYNFINDIEMTNFYREQLLEAYEKAGDQGGVIETKVLMLEGRAWHLNEAHLILPDIEELLEQAIELNLTRTVISLRMRLKYLYEEFGYHDKLEETVEEIEKIVLTDSIHYTKKDLAFHAASGRADLLLKKKKYTQAEQLYQKALGISRLRYGAQHDTWYEIYALHRLAKLEWERSSITKAKAYLDTAYVISAEHKMHDRLVLNLEMKVQLAEAEQRFEDALSYTREMYHHAALQDSVSAGFDVKKYHLQLETERLAADKEKQALELRLKNNQVTYLTAIGVLAFILAVWLYLGYRRQRQRKQELAAQNILIQNQAEELKALDSAKSRFFANVSHELRTPISIILGPIRTLLKENQLTDKQARLLQMAHQGSKNLQLLVNEILDLGKMESGKMELAKSPVQLAAFFTYYFAQFESLGYQKGVSYSYEVLIPKNMTVLLDKEKCRQLVFNLLSNAFKFTPPGGEVKAILKTEMGQLHLYVSDTGKGIHSDDLPHVFNRYFQTNRPDATASGGTGIGLALCQEYVKLFGGNISVESELGEDTVFKVVFPLELAEPALGEDLLNDLASTFKDVVEKPDQLILPTITSVSTANGLKKPTVLVVEDNAELQQYIQLVLKEHYNVSLAENGRAALDKIKANGQPDLIISDLMMPVMDGYQFLEKLKGNPSTQQLPVIMLTARAEKDDRLKALRIGVDDYLTKPFDEEELIVRIGNLLVNQSFRQEAVMEELAEKGEPVKVGISEMDREWLDSFEKYLTQNLSNNNLTIIQLADEFAMSMSTLLRQLKRLTGLTPQKYLVEMRLEKARQLLVEGRFGSISRVAREVGYNDVRNFSKSFKSRFGKKPSELTAI